MTPQRTNQPMCRFFLLAPITLFLLVGWLAAQDAMPHQKGPQWSDEIVYFVLVDRYVDGSAANNVDVDPSQKGHFHGGDLVGLTSVLPELADLGVTALWINPLVLNISGFVHGAGFPDAAYHGYWAEDFERLDPRFGTEAEFRQLVEAAHRLGMKVLLDIVLNHPGYESAYTKRPDAREWLRGVGSSGCGEDDLTTCVAGLPDFKTEKMEVADYLIQAQLHWAKSMGLDGFRLDTVKHVSLDVWQELRRRLDAEIGPHFFLLGEVWGGDAQVLDPYFEAKALNAGFDFSFKGNVTGWLGGRGRTIAFSRYLLKRHKVRPGHHLAHYLSSHDEVGTLFQLDNDVARFKVAAFLQLTTLGIPVIYYGEEVGRLGGEWPENRSDMPWGDRSLLPGKGKPRNEELWHFYQELLRCRREHPPLSRGTFREVHTDGDVLVFAREWEGQAVYVVASRSATDQALVLSSKEFAVLPTLLFGDVVTKVVENGIEMALPAHGVALFAPGEQ